MATRAQIKKALREDGASRALQAMSSGERRDAFQTYAPDGGLPKFVADMPAEEAEKLSKILTPSSWDK